MSKKSWLDSGIQSVTEAIIFLLGTVVGGFVSYYVRLLVSEKKQKTDNFNLLISSIEDTIKTLLKDGSDFASEYEKLLAEAESIENRTLGKDKFVKFLNKEKTIMTFRESKRHLMIARFGHLRRACTSVHQIDKSIYPVPTDKLTNINKAITVLFEESATQGLASLCKTTGELFSHFERRNLL